MLKSAFPSRAVLVLSFAAAATFCPAQTMKVPAVRRPAPAPAPAPVAPAAVPAPVPPVGAATPTVTCVAGASGVMGVPFTGPAITVTGGTPPYSSTDLPAGLSMNGTTGAITGTPTSSGTFNVKVTDHAGATSLTGCPITISTPPGGLTVACPAAGEDGAIHSYVGMAFNSVTITGGASPYTYSSANMPGNLSMDSKSGVISGATTKGSLNKISIKVTDNAGYSQPAVCSHSIDSLPAHGVVFPTHYMGSGAARSANINTFFNTDGALSFFNQIKSIYNGASSSATVSADLASLNFPAGWQVTVGTNIQAGASSPAVVSSGAIPTLSATSAAQATQNMLYGGTIFASGLYPLLASGGSNLSSQAAVGLMVDFLVKEGVDIQNFKPGTSTNVNNPPTHASAQVEGYLQFNSTNLVPGSTTNQFAGALFVGGSYGYSYTSHGYARDYGFGTQVNNGIGQVSAGILINNVAKIALSRAFGPSQTYIDSTSMTQTTVNNFKSWSFGISYQSPPPASK
jgi:hypothetical protein